MRPLRLRARHFRTFPELDVEFGSGVVGILGELRDTTAGCDSNGAGKSSILEALDLALFGRRSLAGYLTRGGDVDELMVELTFEHAGSIYRVRRSYSAKGRGAAKVDLERMGAEFEPLTRATTKETDAVLCDLIGLSQATFRDSSYLRQGDGGYADPARDPRQRKELLVEAVLGRDPVWPKLADAARARRRGSELQIERFAGESERLRAQVAGREIIEQAVLDAAHAVAVAGESLAEAEKRHAAVMEEIAAARERVAARQAAAADLNAAQQELARLEEQAATAVRAELDVLAARDTLVTLATPERLADLEEAERAHRAQVDEHIAACAAYELAAADYRAAAARQQDLLTRVVELRRQADTVLGGVGAAACDRCGQTLGAEAAAQAAASYRLEAQTLDKEAAAIVLPDVPAEPPVAPAGGDQLDPRGLRLVDVARQQQTERARLEERIAQLEQTAAARPDPIALADAQHDVATKTWQLAQIPATTPEHLLDIEGITTAVEQARARREQAVAEKARTDERLTALTEAQDRLAAIDADTADTRAAIDRDALLEKAYGRDGIPALILENTAIPAIEAEASRILRALGSGFDVQLRTQTATKTGGLRDTLDVVVIDQDGNEADYADGCSGGEQTRIGLALRIALARLLANRRGAESRLLALDEPPYLDAAGMSALLDVLRGLDSEFDLVLLVSHVAELRDALEDVIVVVKENGVSRIDGAAGLEQVAA